MHTLHIYAKMKPNLILSIRRRIFQVGSYNLFVGMRMAHMASSSKNVLGHKYRDSIGGSDTEGTILMLSWFSLMKGRGG